MSAQLLWQEPSTLRGQDTPDDNSAQVQAQQLVICFPPGDSYTFRSSPCCFRYPQPLLEAQKQEVHKRWVHGADLILEQLELFPEQAASDADDLYDVEFLDKVISMISRNAIGDWRQGAFAADVLTDSSDFCPRRSCSSAKTSKSYKPRAY